MCVCWLVVPYHYAANFDWPSSIDPLRYMLPCIFPCCVFVPEQVRDRSVAVMWSASMLSCWALETTLLQQQQQQHAEAVQLQTQQVEMERVRDCGSC